jgi:S1-C subfamily serine protease
MNRSKSVLPIVLLLQFVLPISSTALAAENPIGLPQSLRGLGEASKLDADTGRRIVSTLQNAAKTLILERTRGLADVDVYQRAAQAVVFVTDAKESFGSGAIIDPNGHIVTNQHVIAGHPRVYIVLKPKDSTELKKELVFTAVVEKSDEVTDLALLRIVTPPPSLKYLQLGDGGTLAVGQDVHAIGHPVGETWTYTKGIISQIRDNYEWSAGDRRMHRARVIQTQTPINPGNSGGPLLDDNAKLIGLNSFASTQAQGINFAVAVDTIKEFLQREGSRQTPQAERPKTVATEPGCPDAYDTTGRGWKDIVGCYQTATTPPPDLWLVFTAPKKPAAYGATSTLRPGLIDTVIASPDQKWEELVFLYDIDCNGSIDLLGYKAKDSAGITGFSLPQKPLRTAVMTKEIDRALKLRKIPYQSLKVCQ